MADENIKMQYGWCNYRTGQYDYLSDSPKDFSDYVPQIFLNLYRDYVASGVAPAEAAIMVLGMAIGESK